MTEFVDESVSEGEQYQYRVIANNKIGASMPSEPSQPMTAKPMKGTNVKIFCFLT